MFVRPYEILDKVDPVAYKLALSPDLWKIHSVFHVLILKRYRSNPDQVVQIEEPEVELNLSYEDELVYILAREVKKIRNKTIPLVKVLWRNHSTKEVAWERESQMKDQYPQLFSSMNFEDEIF